jgi:hypothetical protein
MLLLRFHLLTSSCLDFGLVQFDVSGFFLAVAHASCMQQDIRIAKQYNEVTRAFQGIIACFSNLDGSLESITNHVERAAVSLVSQGTLPVSDVQPSCTMALRKVEAVGVLVLPSCLRPNNSFLLFVHVAASTSQKIRGLYSTELMVKQSILSALTPEACKLYGATLYGLDPDGVPNETLLTIFRPSLLDPVPVGRPNESKDALTAMVSTWSVEVYTDSAQRDMLVEALATMMHTV